jgi:flagellar biosynthesis chaperone FliJ
MKALEGRNAMNAERRKQIETARVLVHSAFSTLEEARSLLSDIRDEEQEYYDNMPESLQGGEKGDKANEAVNALESAHDEIDGFDFDGVFSSLDEAGQ